LSRYDLLITFFGSAFDLPYLKATYPRLILDQPHIDLCFLAKRLGLRGGLKQIEPLAGIERSGSLRGLDGWDAVRLWNRWRYGHETAALELLLAYNAADAMNLEPLAVFLYDQLVQRYQHGMSTPTGEGLSSCTIALGNTVGPSVHACWFPVRCQKK
jgi:uncharacterized protein YprB with RNaseH-like and TPR domain